MTSSYNIPLLCLLDLITSSSVVKNRRKFLGKINYILETSPLQKVNILPESLILRFRHVEQIPESCKSAN